jgi:putative ABC transport system permease protein
MNLNHLILFTRNLKKHGLITAINSMGLIVGLLSSLFIFEYVFFERSFDVYHQNASRVCRVAYDRYQYGKLQWKTANSFYPTGGWLKANYGEVQDWAVIVRKYNITVSYKNAAGDKVFYNEPKTYYAGDSLFNLFTIPLKEGGRNCLESPNTVAISQRAAERYFGHESPLGKSLTVNGTENYSVTAVFRTIPANSHLQTDFLFSLPSFLNSRPWLYSNWDYDLLHTYLLLAPGVDPVRFGRRALPDMIAKNYQAALNASQIRDEYYLQPVPDIHLHSNIEYETEPPGNAKTTGILYGFAIFLLVVAWINYVNLVTAQSIDRAREIGIKKVIGARKIQLMGQLLSEAFLFNMICLAVTLGLFFFLNPAFMSFANIRDFSLWQNAHFLRMALLIFLSGILLSSAYPALVLSSFRPAQVLKGKFKNSTRGYLLRKGLITVQFIISIVMLIGTIIAFRQASFLMNKDLGVDINSSLVIRAPRLADTPGTRMDKFKLFKSRALELPEVRDFTFSSDIPSQDINNFFVGYRKGFNEDDYKAYYEIAVDDRFLDFYRVKLLAGRKFHKDETHGQRTVLMNKLAAERFGYADPKEAVNKIIVNGTNTEWEVVGVVDDFYFRSVKSAPVPTVITLDDSPKTFLTMKLNGRWPGVLTSLIPKLRKHFETIFPYQPFEYFSLDDKMRFDLRPDRTFASVFSFFSALAILIAVIGIIGLILITINQNLKELGVRVALGAGFGDVSRLLAKQLLTQFSLAMLMAVPLSYYGYKQWFLSTYIHRIGLKAWFFAAPVLVMAFVILSVILLLSVRIFRLKLAEVLKYE